MTDSVIGGSSTTPTDPLSAAIHAAIWDMVAIAERETVEIVEAAAAAVRPLFDALTLRAVTAEAGRDRLRVPLAQARHTAEVAIAAERQANEQLEEALTALERVQALCDSDWLNLPIPSVDLDESEWQRELVVRVDDVRAVLGVEPE